MSRPVPRATPGPPRPVVLTPVTTPGYVVLSVPEPSLMLSAAACERLACELMEAARRVRRRKAVRCEVVRRATVYGDEPPAGSL